MPGLYDFYGLKDALEEKGIEVIDNDVYTPFIHELSKNEQYNNIEFTEEGVIYTDPKGKKWLGFVYKKYKNFGSGGKDDYPRMHLSVCGVTKIWGEEEYFFSNTLPVLCYDTSNGNKPKRLKNIVMCKSCKTIRKNAGLKIYRDAKEYVEFIKLFYKTEKVYDVTKWGYAKDWNTVKHNFITKKGFTCERCGVKLDNIFTRSCLYVYHIDRVLANNDESNLQCLCVDCYMKSYGVEVTEEMKIKSRSLHDYWENKPMTRKFWIKPYERFLL